MVPVGGKIRRGKAARVAVREKRGDKLEGIEVIVGEKQKWKVMRATGGMRKEDRGKCGRLEKGEMKMKGFGYEYLCT